MSDLDKNVNWKMLDISSFQANTVDFNQLVKDGFKGVIIRANNANLDMGKDSCFEMNYSMAKKAGLYVGAYWFIRATDLDFALKESEKFYEYCKDKKFELPLYADIECSEQFAKGKKFCSDLAETFCANLQKKHKMFVGIYCSTYYYTNFFTDEVRNYYATWIADWGNMCQYKGQYGMWQKGTIRTKGVSNGNSDVDFDICYVDYPTAIKNRGMNGFEKKNVELDSVPLYSYGSTDWALYCIKESMMLAKEHNLMNTYVDANYITYTKDLETAVNELLEKWGYIPNGILGKNFLIKFYGYLRNGVK